jgi:hypothetical protein
VMLPEKERRLEKKKKKLGESMMRRCSRFWKRFEFWCSQRRKGA